MDFFAIVSSSLAGEGSADLLQQGAGLFIGVRGGADDHIHAADLVDLVVLDLGEDQLLPDAQGIVAAAVEGVGVDALEVADAGQGHVDRKSTRLNSSHVSISYAVFCLTKNSS